jgi:hypothetical protein
VKLWFPYALAVTAIACTPDIHQDPPPPAAIVALFDPGAPVPVVPAPNDLAKDPNTGKLVVPSTDATPAAQREFNTDYLGGLGGFPVQSTAEVLLSGDVKPETVTKQTVVILDLTTDKPVITTPVWNAEKKSIAVPPPEGGWTRAHQYVVALIGGAKGIRGANDELVIGSPAWVLVSGRFPLFVCADDGTCEPTVDIIPSDKTDPHQKFDDQVAKAKRLDQLRQGYAPLLDGIAKDKQISREDIPILWTFTIHDSAELTFDPGNRVIPFPNDAVRPNGKVSLPNPATGAPLSDADCKTALSDPHAAPQLQLMCGLNTLDGFSTQVAPISENSDTQGLLQQANADPKSINAKSVGLVVLKSGVPEGTTPKFTPCLNCLSSGDPKKERPQQLQWRLDAPLDEKTTYLAYVTTDVMDDRGEPIIAPPTFALLRSRSPLVEDGKPTVSSLSATQAIQLEPLRAAMAPALDKLDASGIPRTKLALAFAFTTQSEGSVLDQLAQVPAKAEGLPGAPIGLDDVTARVTAMAGGAGIPIDAIAKFHAGAFLTPVLVTGPGGTLDPTKPRVERVDFMMSTPKSPAPAGGYPVVIFGHGFTRWRNDFLPIANSLAKAGLATIASDVLFHGERTSCTGSKAATKQSTDDAACAKPAEQKCNGDPILGLCVARDDTKRNECKPGPAGDGVCAAAGQGRCALDAKCQAADLARDASGKPAISGWNIFSLTNFFATRDNFRQQVIDLSQLVRVIKSPGATGLADRAGVMLDSGSLGYVGQSLGGILGTLFNSASADTTNVVLNVPGGALPSIILNAPSFAAQKTVLIDTLEAQGIVEGTPAFDQFLGIIQWILDPADPSNMAYRLTHGPNPKRKAFIQFIEGDQTVPNVSNLALVRAANRSFTATPPSFGCTAPLFCYEFTERKDGFNATTMPLQSRHGFLLSANPMTAKAQTQAATFLAAGMLP